MEAKRTLRFNPLSNFFSVIGTGLILFLLGMVLMGWTVGDQLIASLRDEAEVSVYFVEGTDKEEALALVDTIKTIEGVFDASYIEETQAHAQMEEMLGEEAQILELFEENPFEAYLEVRINLELMDAVLSDVKELNRIEYVRDNREVLKQIKGITEGLKLLGTLVILAVGITTLIIISHMIRQGIYNNKDQINTLRLLGAPNSFIGFPFVLTGTLLTLCGGALAIILLIIIINGGYSQLSSSIPFIPVPAKSDLREKVSLTLLAVSILLGLLGSVFGLSSIKHENN
jgi:cell division transport system permease protein